jgi:hypothetical protein
VLLDWPNLSHCVRPRVMWVAAQCLTLPAHSSDAWDLLLRCLSDLLLHANSASASRSQDLSGSSLAGSLYKAGRVAWAQPDRPFMFDVAAASALCEAPEYAAAGVASGLCTIQQLLLRLNNAVAEAVAVGAAGKAHTDAAPLARKLESILKQLMVQDAAGAQGAHRHARTFVFLSFSIHSFFR